MLGALLALTLNAPGQSSPSALTYNGRLADGGNAVNGWYDFTLNLYTNSASGTPIGNSPQLLTHVGVVNGSFTVTADFGTNLFNGEPRWLEIGVRTNGGNAFATMNPRYAVGSVPVAQYAITAQNMFSQTFPHGIAVYTNAGTFTWTNPGVSSVLVKMWGGGGGAYGLFGGGGGAYCEGVIQVSNNLQVVVGAGGSVGNDGSNSIISSMVAGGGRSNGLGGGQAAGGMINVSGNPGFGNPAFGDTQYGGPTPGGAAGCFPPLSLAASRIISIRSNDYITVHFKVGQYPGGGAEGSWGGWGGNGYDGMVVIYY